MTSILCLSALIFGLRFPAAAATPSTCDYCSSSLSTLPHLLRSELHLSRLFYLPTDAFHPQCIDEQRLKENVKKMQCSSLASCASVVVRINDTTTFALRGCTERIVRPVLELVTEIHDSNLSPSFCSTIASRYQDNATFTTCVCDAKQFCRDDTKGLHHINDWKQYGLELERLLLSENSGANCATFCVALQFYALVRLLTSDVV